MKKGDIVRVDVPGHGGRKQSRARGLFSIGGAGAGSAVKTDPEPDGAPPSVVVGARFTDSRQNTKNRRRTSRPKAIVIDPDDSGRVFVAEALTLFEPGFEVVAVAGLGEAAEWMQTFSPDLLVVSESLEHNEATRFVTGLLAAPDSRHCKVVFVEQVGNGEATMAHWRHAALSQGAGLSEWLETVRYVLAS
jgi:hypothetical protein